MAGHWVGKVRGVANQFRSGFDTMIRESELQEMEKKWAAENERIMREHPSEPVHMLPMTGPHGETDDAPPVTVEPPLLHAPADTEPTVTKADPAPQP